MKIIFDSEEQRKKFFNIVVGSSNACPREIGLKEPESNTDCWATTCADCWIGSGIEIEVKEKTNENCV